MRSLTLLRPIGALAASLLLVSALGGCAIFKEENRRTLNLLDKHVQFKSTAAKVAAGPVFVPVGAVVLATDAAVVNPVAVLPKTADDVYQLYWKPRDMDFFRKALFFPFCVVLTPPTFAGDWILRILFIGNDKN
jgi:hypothetical protein